MAGVLVYKSNDFITTPVRAVFPDLNKPDKFGNYKIDVDVLEHPELEQQIQNLALKTIEEAQSKLGVTKDPSNDLFRTGEYKDQPFRRVSFKMRSVKTVKGVEVAQKPRLVDAHRKPVTELIFGGSLVKIAYFLQYTVTPTGTFLSPKLNAVQVIEHVGPGGEAAIESLFEEEEGFVSEGAVQAAVEEAIEPMAAASGADF